MKIGLTRDITILAFIIGFILTGCKNSEPERQSALGNAPVQNEAHTSNLDQKVNSDTLYQLLENSLQKDSFEFVNPKPFLAIKTGYLLSYNVKNAILINCPTDSTYRIALYSASHNKWGKNDEINVSDLEPTFFYFDFRDYDFDGQKDIYINCTSSNGYSLSRGHLLTYNPKTKKLKTHPETRDLANMHPDPKTRTLISEEVIFNSYGFQGVCDLRNKWVKGKLKRMSKKCPSKNPRGL